MSMRSRPACRVRAAEPDREARRRYFRELFRLQRELVKLQDWVVSTAATRW